MPPTENTRQVPNLQNKRGNLTYNITIGNNLQSLQYAIQNNTKLILNRLGFPDTFAPSHIKNTWGLLYTKLMLDGKVIGGDTVKNIRITENEVQVVCEYNIINKVKYDNLYIFCDKNIIGLPEVIKEIDKHTVIDILRCISLITPYKEKIITTKEDLVKKLYILKENESSPTEVYSISSLTKDQLLDFDYSDTMVKFKSEDLLKQNGFKGAARTSNNYRSPITLEVVERIVRKEMDEYQETENIKFFYGS